MKDSIEILYAGANDRANWNAFVEKSDNASPYHRFEWLEAVQYGYRHKNRSLIARSKSDNIVVGVLPIIEISPPWGKTFWCSLPFCDVGACIASSEKIEADLLNEAKTLCEQHNILKFEYRDFARDDLNPNPSEEKDFPDSTKVRMLLDLPETGEALLAGFKSKLRSQINKAIKNGLTFRIVQDTSQLDAFYDVFKRNMRSLGSPVHSKNWFESVLKCYQQNAVMSIVYKDEVPIGGGIILRNDHTFSIPWASTRSDYNRLAPNMLLYWSLLEYAADNGGNVFDFGRSSMNEGTYKFKKQWGAQPQSLEWSVFENGEFVVDKNISEKSMLRKSVEQLWPRVPLSLTVIIGSAVRRYISL